MEIDYYVLMYGSRINCKLRYNADPPLGRTHRYLKGKFKKKENTAIHKRPLRSQCNRTDVLSNLVNLKSKVVKRLKLMNFKI